MQFLRFTLLLFLNATFESSMIFVLAFSSWILDLCICDLFNEWWFKMLIITRTQTYFYWSLTQITPQDGASVTLIYLVFFCLHLWKWKRRHRSVNANALELFCNLELRLFMPRGTCQTNRHFRFSPILPERASSCQLLHGQSNVEVWPLYIGWYASIVSRMIF